MRNTVVACVVMASLASGAGCFPVQNRAVSAAEPATRIEVYKVLSEGRKLSDDQVKELEDAVKQKPDDVQSRIKLLSHYFTRQRDRETRKTRQAHVLWLIENQPRNAIFDTGYAGLDQSLDGDAYFHAKTAWMKHVDANPNDTVILGNAAAFLLLGRREEAQAILERCIQLEPDNEAWHRKLGHLVKLDANRGSVDQRKRLSSRAVKEFEQALRLSTIEAEKTSLRVDLAKTAFQAGEFETARGYAAELLNNVNKNPTGSNNGNAIHDANVVLGRLALVDGDVPGAKAYLLAAGKTPGAPNLNSFGPNMSLAKELLERGETQTVLDYFDLCAKFWKSGQAKLKTWSTAVKAGIAPDFQANLVY